MLAAGSVDWPVKLLGLQAGDSAVSFGMVNPPVLLYDGSCGFCQSSVQFVLRRDRKRTLRFAPLQGEFGRAVIGRHPKLAGVDSVVWVDDPDGEGERVWVRSDAAGKALGYLGGWWRLLRIFWIVPRPIRNRIYGLVARHRHRILPAGDVCVIPEPADRWRFLE